jgi:hypothetical protein
LNTDKGRLHQAIRSSYEFTRAYTRCACSFVELSTIARTPWQRVGPSSWKELVSGLSYRGIQNPHVFMFKDNIQTDLHATPILLDYQFGCDPDYPCLSMFKSVYYGRRISDRESGRLSPNCFLQVPMSDLHQNTPGFCKGQRRDSCLCDGKLSLRLLGQDVQLRSPTWQFNPAHVSWWTPAPLQVVLALFGNFAKRSACKLHLDKIYSYLFHVTGGVTET